MGVADRLYMLEHAIYSVISPEGCAAILWKDQSAVNLAAESLKFSSKDLLKLGIIDKVIPEPPGGAHIDYEQTFKNVDRHLRATLKKLEETTPEKRVVERYQKFRRMGVFVKK